MPERIHEDGKQHRVDRAESEWLGTGQTEDLIDREQKCLKRDIQGPLSSAATVWSG